MRAYAVAASLLSLSALPVHVAAASTAKPALVKRQQTCDAARTNTPWWQLRGGNGPACPPPAAPFSLESMRTMHPVLLAFLGTSFGWFMTALGSAAVIVHKFGLDEKMYRKVLDFMLGVSGGVMTAASYWSLLAPALEFAELQV